MGKKPRHYWGWTLDHPDFRNRCVWVCKKCPAYKVQAYRPSASINPPCVLSSEPAEQSAEAAFERFARKTDRKVERLERKASR
jgi:hypothetical protein